MRLKEVLAMYRYEYNICVVIGIDVCNKYQIQQNLNRHKIISNSEDRFMNRKQQYI